MAEENDEDRNELNQEDIAQLARNQLEVFAVGIFIMVIASFWLATITLDANLEDHELNEMSDEEYIEELFEEPYISVLENAAAKNLSSGVYHLGPEFADEKADWRRRKGNQIFGEQVGSVGVEEPNYNYLQAIDELQNIEDSQAGDSNGVLHMAERIAQSVMSTDQFKDFIQEFQSLYAPNTAPNRITRKTERMYELYQFSRDIDRKVDGLFQELQFYVDKRISNLVTIVLKKINQRTKLLLRSRGKTLDRTPTFYNSKGVITP